VTARSPAVDRATAARGPAAGPPNGRRPVGAESVIGRGPRADVHGRGVLTLILLASLAWSVLQVEWQDGLLRSGGLALLGELVGGMLRPDLSGAVVRSTLDGVWVTAVYAVAGLSLALVLGIPLGVIASGVLAAGARRHAAVALGRGVLGALRAVHELVWAWLFVIALGLSPFAAIFALALPYAGILGRIYADLLNDVPPAPLAALHAAGAGERGVLLYGRLPMALPDIVAYTFYRLECALRSAAIMGFVGLGGLGYQVQIALDGLRYEVAATHLLGLLVLIVGVEAWSALVRRELAR